MSRHNVWFYSLNLFDYEQGVAPAVVKGRLKAHFQFWLDIGPPPQTVVLFAYLLIIEMFCAGQE